MTCHFRRRRQRPDLRRDCDFIFFLLAFICLLLLDDKDLIYEGIAIIVTFFFCSISFKDDKDLIYEGIAMFCCIFPFWDAPTPDDKDLIYEGIAILTSVFDLAPVFSDDKDLIYEGIAISLRGVFKGGCLLDDKDLIYEGIAILVMDDCLDITIKTTKT